MDIGSEFEKHYVLDIIFQTKIPSASFLKRRRVSRWDQSVARQSVRWAQSVAAVCEMGSICGSALVLSARWAQSVALQDVHLFDN